MIKAILIDDEALARDVVKHYLSAYPHIAVVAECSDGFEGLKAISTHQPDLIFLDIQMPKINGFELLELLDHKPSVIFTTAFDEYAIKAFEVNAVDYLLKPITQDRFEQALTKLPTKVEDAAISTGLLATAGQSPTQSTRVVVKTEGLIKILPIAGINYIEADDDYVKLNTDEGVYQKNKTMSFYEANLAEAQFIRIHRSYLVNLAKVSKITLKEKDSYMVLLSTGIWLPVSKAGYVKLKAALGL